LELEAIMNKELFLRFFSLSSRGHSVDGGVVVHEVLHVDAEGLCPILLYHGDDLASRHLWAFLRSALAAFIVVLVEGAGAC